MRDDFDILACLGNTSNEEVFTPTPLAKAMLDILPKDIWTNPNVRILDPVCKSGVFLLEAAKRLDKGLKTVIPDMQERINHILEKQIFGIPVTRLASSISRRTLYGSKTANDKYSIAKCFSNGTGNVPDACSKHEWVGGRCTKCGAQQKLYSRQGMESYAYPLLHDGIEEIFGMPMEFDVVIGNPPYQLTDGGNGGSAVPLYQEFVKKAKALQPKHMVMIIPARWYAGGKGLDEFRDIMLRDQHVCELVDYPNASECFPDVSIKGGVCYFLWNRDKVGSCRITTKWKGETTVSVRQLLEKKTGTFIRYAQGASICEKVAAKGEPTFDAFVSTRQPFGLTNAVHGKKKEREDDLKLYGYQESGFIERSKIKKNASCIDKHKVFLSKAYGAGDDFPHQIINKPFLGEPGSVCTETHLMIGPCASKQEALNVISYIQTKFFRFLVFLLKITQNTTQNVYRLVPMQDFSRSWTDDDLYKKYDLTDEEIAFIEKMIRPM